MSFSVENFRQALQYDGQRPNLFQVYMTMPSSVLNSTTSGQELSFLCKTAQIPGSTTGIVPMYYFGREIPLPGNVTYDNWTITIINDEDYMVKNSIENWRNLLNSHVGNLRDPSMQNYLGYGASGYVTTYGKTGNNTAIYNFQGLWPTNDPIVDLDWGQNDTVMEFTCTFAVLYWWNTVTTDQPGTTATGTTSTTA